jgi:hypothetical protein
MTKKLAIGLALLCLPLCVSCSSSKPKVVTVTEIVRVVPPAHLMEPTPEPDCSNATDNAGLFQCAQDRLEALRRSNADKAATKASCEEAGR